MNAQPPTRQSDNPSNSMERRQVLMGAGAVGAAAVLAACSSSSTSGAAPSPAQSNSPAPSKGAANVIAETSQVPEKSGLLVEDKQVIITQPKAGEYKCFSSICPHQGCTVSEFEAQKVTCPCHGSQFSSTTGDVLRGPATTGLTQVDIKVEGTQIVTT